jgi:murein tripeptide amidase MpaA
VAYLTVDEIEADVQSLGAGYPTVTEILALPNLTAEGRSTHALRIGPPDSKLKDTVVITGGIHAREWVPPDALINLAADLLEAHALGTGLRYGGKRYSATDVRWIIEERQVVLFPCVNPDGRHFSQTSSNPMWRKNRRHINPNPDSDCVGVDLNRNFDALWDFRRHFAPDSGVSASDDPCDPEVYVGPEAASEAETRNVVWLLDRFPRLRWFIDVHSHVPAIYYAWGFDENQTVDPTMSFRNEAYNHQRGRRGDSYSEYVRPADLAVMQHLGQVFKDAVNAASGQNYDLSQSFSLYPTSGCSDDYANGLSFSEGRRSSVLGFTVECGRSFYPPWQEAENVIKEVCAGLTAFCVSTREKVEIASSPS